MQSVPDILTVEQDALLCAVTKRALAKFPEARTRIEKGAALVRQDAVTDLTRVHAHAYSVRSASDAARTYAVTSNGTTTCDCPDAHYREHVCAHGFAVLLARALRKLANKPRLRHGYHGASGEECWIKVLDAVEVQCWPGGRQHSFICAKEEVELGPLVEPAVWR